MGNRYSMIRSMDVRIERLLAERREAGADLEGARDLAEYGSDPYFEEIRTYRRSYGRLGETPAPLPVALRRMAAEQRKVDRALWSLAAVAASMVLVLIVAFQADDLVSRPAQDPVNATGNPHVWKSTITGRNAMMAGGDSAGASLVLEASEVAGSPIVEVVGWKCGNSVIYATMRSVPGEDFLLADRPETPASNPSDDLVSLAIERGPVLVEMARDHRLPVARRDTAEVDGVAVEFDVFDVAELGGVVVELLLGRPSR